MSTNVCNFLFVVLVYCVIASAISIRISTHTKVKQDLLVSDNFLQKSLTNNDIECPQDDWVAGVSYPAGSTVKHNNKLYEAFAATSEEPLCENDSDCVELQLHNWKFISSCKILDHDITLIAKADSDAKTELCGDSREDRKEDKKEEEEVIKKIDDEIKNTATKDDEPTIVEDTTPTPTPNVNTPTPVENTTPTPVENTTPTPTVNTSTPAENTTTTPVNNNTTTTTSTETKSSTGTTTSSDNSNKTTTVKSNSQQTSSGSTAGAGTSTSSGELEI